MKKTKGKILIVKDIYNHRNDKRAEHYWGQWKQAIYSTGLPYVQWRKCESCGFVEKQELD